MAKYGMSMCVLGMAEELSGDGVAVNALWPRTAIDTAALAMLGGFVAAANSRKPEILADAAHWILTQPARQCTGNFFIDDEVLTARRSHRPRPLRRRPDPAADRGLLPVKLASACPLDCPDACSLDVTVEEGRVVKLDGARDRNPVTAGLHLRQGAQVPRAPLRQGAPAAAAAPRRRARAKGRFEARLVGGGARPRRGNGSSRRATDTAARRSCPYCYGGSNGYLSQDTTDALLFHRLGASRLARTVCAAATGSAALGLYGKMEGVAFTDYPAARLVVVWGSTPPSPASTWSRRSRRRATPAPGWSWSIRGATPIAKQADLHLALRPGTDLVVALAVIRELFASGRADRDFLARHATGAEELERRAAPWTLEKAAAVAGIAVADLERFVDLYAATSPAVVRCGWGLERNRNGGSAVAAVLALPAVAGKFGVRGGGYTLSNSSAWKMNAGALCGPEPETRTINMNRLGAALTATAEPPVQLLFVYNSNALMTSPNQTLVRRGLEREDLFTVVFDQVLTDTARYADLVLPATTFLEHRELARGYGAFVLQEIAPVIAPVGEARSNYSVFAELAVRTGVARADEIPDEAAAVGAASRVERPRPPSCAKRWRAGVTPGLRRRDCPVQFVDVFPKTPDRRIHLVPEPLDAEAPMGLYAYQPDPASPAAPLALISPATNRTISSTLGQLRKGPVALEMHPDDAAARGLADGQRVRVANAARRGALPVADLERPAAGSRRAAERPLGSQHRQRRHRLRPRARQLDRPRPGRLLQRRPRRSHAGLTGRRFQPGSANACCRSSNRRRRRGGARARCFRRRPEGSCACPPPAARARSGSGSRPPDSRAPAGSPRRPQRSAPRTGSR